jgi:hypothetical protein
MMVEAHTEEERARRGAWTSTAGAQWRHTRRRSKECGVNLDGGHAGGMDLDRGRAA